jgi:hypothetical protein
MGGSHSKLVEVGKNVYIDRGEYQCDELKLRNRLKMLDVRKREALDRLHNETNNFRNFYEIQASPDGRRAKIERLTQISNMLSLRMVEEYNKTRDAITNAYNTRCALYDTYAIYREYGGMPRVDDPLNENNTRYASSFECSGLLEGLKDVDPLIRQAF